MTDLDLAVAARNRNEDNKNTKPSQSVNWEAEICAKRKSTSPSLLAIPAFDPIAGLSNRFLNSNRVIC